MKKATVPIEQTERPGQLERVNGVLVFTGPVPLGSAEDFIAQSRDERIDDLMRDVLQPDPLSKHGGR